MKITPDGIKKGDRIKIRQVWDDGEITVIGKVSSVGAGLVTIVGNGPWEVSDFGMTVFVERRPIPEPTEPCIVRHAGRVFASVVAPDDSRWTEVSMGSVPGAARDPVWLMRWNALLALDPQSVPQVRPLWAK